MVIPGGWDSTWIETLRYVGVSNNEEWRYTEFTELRTGHCYDSVAETYCQKYGQFFFCVTVMSSEYYN